jgi:hypothetical protein
LASQTNQGQPTTIPSTLPHHSQFGTTNTISSVQKSHANDVQLTINSSNQFVLGAQPPPPPSTVHPTLVSSRVPVPTSLQLPVRARALFDYEGSDCNNLSFKRNEIITIRQQTDANWCIGESNGKQGFLPISFVQLIEDMTATNRAQGHLRSMVTTSTSNTVGTLPRGIPMNHIARPVCKPTLSAVSQLYGQRSSTTCGATTGPQSTVAPIVSTGIVSNAQPTLFYSTTSSVHAPNGFPVQMITSPTCRALYDFRVADVADKSCLCFAKHDLILFIRKVDDNWAEGRIGNRVGIFPTSFVEMLPPGTTSHHNASAHQSRALEAIMATNKDEQQRNGARPAQPATSNKPLHARSNSLNAANTMNRSHKPPPYAIAANSSAMVMSTSGQSNIRAPVGSSAIYETLLGPTDSTNKRHSLCLLQAVPATVTKATGVSDTVEFNNRQNQFQSLEMLSDRCLANRPHQSPNSNSFDNLLSIRSNAQLE